MTILKNNKPLQYFLIILFIIAFGVNVFSSCASMHSAEDNITKKKIDCKMNLENALPCCLQMMSSASGNDSKDMFCADVVKETVDSLRQERKQNLFIFCFESRDNSKHNCWDKIHTK